MDSETHGIRAKQLLAAFVAVIVCVVVVVVVVAHIY